MKNRTSTSVVALLLGAIAVALHDSGEAFSPAVSPRIRPAAIPGGRGRRTEASLFRRRKGRDAAVDAPDDGEGEAEGERPGNSRRSFLSGAAAAASLLPLQARASGDKQTNLPNDELKKIIRSDVVDRDFLVTADITRSVYDESATFTDEIDKYTMDKWIKGTQALFIPSGSRTSLVGDVEVTPAQASFRFDEDLMFNIPFKPVCSLSGRVVLTRDENTGLITSYREYWDQSVNEVLKTAKFGKKAH